MPELLRTTGAGYTALNAYFSTFAFSGMLGLAVAFLAVARCAKVALVTVLAVAIVATAPTVLSPQLLLLPAYLELLAVAHGVINALFPIAGAIFLSSGRANRGDFAGALVLLFAAVLVASVIPVTLTSFSTQIWGPSTSASCLIAAMGVAIAVLLTCTQLTFDDVPAPRHTPLELRQRSPWLVLFLTTVPVVVATGLFAGAFAATMSFFGGGRIEDTLTHPMALLAIAFVVLWIAYIAYWLYRIHGELAAAAASPRLLTPRAALLIGLFLPLGMIVILMTLADLLNERAYAQGGKRAIAPPLIGLCSVLLPPVAMALIQNAANKAQPAI